jgi:hypothetical protein
MPLKRFGETRKKQGYREWRRWLWVQMGPISGVIAPRFRVMLERNSLVKLNAGPVELIMEPPDKKNKAWAAPSILTAGKVDWQHVHNSDGLAENLFGCGGQIIGIFGLDFCGAILVWHEHIQNTVVNAFHPHPEAKSVEFARTYQGI